MYIHMYVLHCIILQYVGSVLFFSFMNLGSIIVNARELLVLPQRDGIAFLGTLL